MASATPEEAIRQSLMAERIVTSRRRSPGARGWTAETSTGGLDAKPLSVQFLRARAQPWAHLGGGGWPRQFYAGAYVDDQSVVQVRLTSANGVVLDDTVDHGVALFLADAEVQVPMQAELFDAWGNLIGQHVAFA